MQTHEVITAVEEHFGINTSQRSRRRDVVDARMAIMVALRPMFSMAEIGRIFSYTTRKEGKTVYQPMSHCTVVHAVRQHKWRYHPEPAKRMVSYRLYGDIYDFAVGYLNSEDFKPMTQMDMRTAIDHEAHLRKQAEQKAAAIEEKLLAVENEAKKLLKGLRKNLAKVTNERDHYKKAFAQLYKEKKANEEMV